MFTGQRLVGDFSVPPSIDMLAVILFAITGALSAAKRDYDWIGTAAIALVTGCGGGLIRDILLNVRPVILEHDHYLLGVVAAVVVTVFFCQTLSKFRWIFAAADALGLAIYAVVGTQKTFNEGFGITAAILIGTLNAIGGGLVRDILTGEEVSLLKPGELHAAIAFGASLVFALLLYYTAMSAALAGVLVVLPTCAAKYFAHRFNLSTRPLRPVGFDSSRW